MSDDAPEELKSLTRVLDACAGASHDRLDVLQLAWVLVADWARNEALITPGGFQEEQTRQVTVLRHMISLVETAEPDRETERLVQEADFEGLLRRLQQQMDVGENGAGAGS